MTIAIKVVVKFKLAFNPDKLFLRAFRFYFILGYD